MAYDEAATGRVRQALSNRPDVTARKMMGAICFMVGGHMCCGVTGSALLVRTGPDIHEQMLTQPHVRPMEIAGRRMGGFVMVDPQGFRTDAALANWIRLALNFVSTLPPKPSASTQL